MNVPFRFVTRQVVPVLLQKISDNLFYDETGNAYVSARFNVKLSSGQAYVCGTIVESLLRMRFEISKEYKRFILYDVNFHSDGLVTVTYYSL